MFVLHELQIRSLALLSAMMCLVFACPLAAAVGSFEVFLRRTVQQDISRPSRAESSWFSSSSVVLAISPLQFCWPLHPAPMARLQLFGSWCPSPGLQMDAAEPFPLATLMQPVNKAPSPPPRDSNFQPSRERLTAIHTRLQSTLPETRFRWAASPESFSQVQMSGHARIFLRQILVGRPGPRLRKTAMG